MRSVAVPTRAIQRWFQFGILDLLILIAAVAVIMALCRPVQPRQSLDPVINLSVRLRAHFAGERRLPGGVRSIFRPSPARGSRSGGALSDPEKHGARL